MSERDDPKKPADGLADDVAKTRDEFAATLDAIEDRLNPKTQLRRARSRVSNDPKVLAAAAVGAAGLAAAVTGVARLVSRARR